MSTSAARSTPAQLGFSRKDASHGAFYAGVGKGMISAFDGLHLFITSPQLRSVFWDLLKPIRNAQVAYAVAGLLLFFLLRDPADDVTELFWVLSRWGRIITLAITFLLEKRFKATSKMFFAALKAKSPGFGAALESKVLSKMTLRDKFTKFKRIGKVTLFKLAGTGIKKFFPGGKVVAIPAIKFFSMRPVLGTGIAAAIAIVHAIPAEVLESWWVDDFLVSFGEAVIDADDQGADSTKEYTKRLDSEEMRMYFTERYRGYRTGCGFVYSLLCAVPFLGIPMILVAECGAACVVIDIVQRNIEKENRKPLACEEALLHVKKS